MSVLPYQAQAQAHAQAQAQHQAATSGMHTLAFLGQMQQLGALPPHMLPLLMQMHGMGAGGGPGGPGGGAPGAPGLPPGFPGHMLMPGMHPHPLASLQNQLHSFALFQVCPHSLANETSILSILLARIATVPAAPTCKALSAECDLVERQAED